MISLQKNVLNFFYKAHLINPVTFYIKKQVKALLHNLWRQHNDMYLSKHGVMCTKRKQKRDITVDMKK